MNFSVGCPCNNSYDRVTLTDYLQEVKSLYNSQDILKEGKLTRSLKALKRVEVTSGVVTSTCVARGDTQIL